MPDESRILSDYKGNTEKILYRYPEKLLRVPFLGATYKYLKIHSESRS
jgi:hypothetical protein